MNRYNISKKACLNLCLASVIGLITSNVFALPSLGGSYSKGFGTSPTSLTKFASCLTGGAPFANNNGGSQSQVVGNFNGGTTGSSTNTIYIKGTSQYPMNMSIINSTIWPVNCPNNSTCGSNVNHVQTMQPSDGTMDDQVVYGCACLYLAKLGSKCP